MANAEHSHARPALTLLVGGGEPSPKQSRRIAAADERTSSAAMELERARRLLREAERRYEQALRSAISARFDRRFARRPRLVVIEGGR